MATGAVGRLMRGRARDLILAGILAGTACRRPLPSLPFGSPASSSWTLVATPLAVSTGMNTVFVLTAMNEDRRAGRLSREIGWRGARCRRTSSSLAIVTGSNAGNLWHVDSVVGNRVTVHTDSGGERLSLLDWARFSVSATAMSAGS